MKDRTIGGYKYINCPECEHEIRTEKPIRLDLPYCGECGKAIEDPNQNYCGWCGCALNDEIDTTSDDLLRESIKRIYYKAILRVAGKKIADDATCFLIGHDIRWTGAKNGYVCRRCKR